MTDKTKPWLTAAHPEGIACKKVADKLYDELAQKGVHLMGVGITTSKDGQSAAIYILVLSKKDKAKVPSMFEGYEVKCSVTGVIRPLR